MAYNTYLPEPLSFWTHQPNWETSPNLPSWLVATNPTDTQHVVIPGTGGTNPPAVYRHALVGSGNGLVNGTEVKTETLAFTGVSNVIDFRVADWRVLNAAAADVDCAIYIDGPELGVRLEYIAANGATRIWWRNDGAPLIVTNPTECEIFAGGQNGRIKRVGLRLFTPVNVGTGATAGTAKLHVYVDDKLRSEYLNPSWPLTGVADNRVYSGISMIRRAGLGAPEMRYSTVRAAFG